jgi:hypothetical protein
MTAGGHLLLNTDRFTPRSPPEFLVISRIKRDGWCIKGMRNSVLCESFYFGSGSGYSAFMKKMALTDLTCDSSGIKRISCNNIRAFAKSFVCFHTWQSQISSFHFSACVSHSSPRKSAFIFSILLRWRRILTLNESFTFTAEQEKLYGSHFRHF